MPDPLRDGRERRAVLRLSEPVAIESVATEADAIARAAALCAALIPEPQRREDLPAGGVLLIGGDPARVVVRITAAGVRVGAARLRFWGKRPVLVEERIGGLGHGLLPADDTAASAVLAGLVAAADALRRSELRPCGRCGDLRAPEEGAIVAKTSGACPFCARDGLSVPGDATRLDAQAQES